MNGELAKLVLAVQFLTRLPLRTDKMFTPERMAQAPRYFPLVGILVGLQLNGKQMKELKRLAPVLIDAEAK